MQQALGLQGIEPHPRHHQQGAAPGIRLPATQAQLGTKRHEQQREEGAVAGQQGPLAPWQQRAIGAADQGQPVEQGTRHQSQSGQPDPPAEGQQQDGQHQGGQEPEVDHATHPPGVERIPQLHLPLACHAGQIAFRHGRDRVEGHQQIEQAPGEPESQQGAAVAQRHRHGLACGEGGLQEVAGAEEEQRHREAAQLVDDGPEPEVGGAVPEGGIERIAEGREVNGHHGQDGQDSPALDAGDVHDGFRRLKPGTLAAGHMPLPAGGPPTVTPIGARLPFVTRGMGRVTPGGRWIPFWCR